MLQSIICEYRQHHRHRDSVVAAKGGILRTNFFSVHVNFKSFFLELIIDILQFRILRCKATAGCGIDNQQNLTLIIGKRNFITVLCGYFMASRGMLWKKVIVGMIMFTMFFNGGLIPGFLNIQSLGLYNTLWALIIPGCLSVYNSIICKTAIEGIPESLTESAYIDGANDFQVIFKIILPLIKPTVAVLTLYYGVARWNDWFQASIYIKDTNLLPVQNIIRAVLLENDIKLNSSGNFGDDYNQYADALKYSAIVVSTVPILCVYPFLQKYFTKGVMIGAVKG